MASLSPKKAASVPNSPSTAPAVGSYGNTDPKNVEELTVFVENLLGQMQEKFQSMSDSILSRMDDMGSRIDELEKSIGDLMQQAGIEETTGKHEK